MNIYLTVRSKTLAEYENENYIKGWNMCQLTLIIVVTIYKHYKFTIWVFINREQYNVT